MARSAPADGSKNLGGTIEINSEIGRGTTFAISLPLATQETHVFEAPKETGISRALRILVADDQEVICELIAEYLRADGHSVEIACDGTDAMQKFDPARFDMVNPPAVKSITPPCRSQVQAPQLRAALYEYCGSTGASVA